MATVGLTMVPKLEFSPDAAMLLVVVLAFCFHVWRTVWNPRHAHITNKSNVATESNPPLVRGMPQGSVVDPDDMDFEMWQRVW